MQLRSVALSSLCSGILFFFSPFLSYTSQAQSSEGAAPRWSEIANRSDGFPVRSSADSGAGFAADFAGPEFQWNGPGGESPAEAHVDLLALIARWHRDVVDHPGQAGEDETERYHWKGLLWQSLAFIGAENAYRLGTDNYLRHLLATGPYWRNYAISMEHWDMNRWNDGDSFAVDDIGHPMQGAVSGYIWIQNSPSDRNLRIGESSAYWKSRLKALAWMTAYSTQQKIGPLGEAALGNAGGYTYPLHCPYPCSNPNVEYTNNTGWTDFIMTPAGGFVWIVGEDFIDRYVSDRIQGDSDRLVFKIVRGALNPSRTAANFLRGKNPWYRDYLHPAAGAGRVHFERPDDELIRHLPRYEIFPHFNAISLPVNTSTCVQCRRWTDGAGVGFSVRLTRWADFDSDVNYQPEASPRSSLKAGGNIVMGTFGLRSGITTPHYALKAAVRPGFVSYDRAYFGPVSVYPIQTIRFPQFPVRATLAPGATATSGLATGRITHFAASLAISADYGITRNLAVRGVFGNTPVRYLDGYLVPPGVGQAPYINWLSKEFFMTNENWTYQFGPVLRF